MLAFAARVGRLAGFNHTTIGLPCIRHQTPNTTRIYTDVQKFVIVMKLANQVKPVSLVKLLNLMHQVSRRHNLFQVSGPDQATLPTKMPPPPPPHPLLLQVYLLIRLTKGKTKAQIVACMHAPSLSPFCRRRFVSFGVALPICGRIRARAAPGWDPCMWEG